MWVTIGQPAAGIVEQGTISSTGAVRLPNCCALPLGCTTTLPPSNRYGNEPLRQIGRLMVALTIDIEAPTSRLDGVHAPVDVTLTVGVGTSAIAATMASHSRSVFWVRYTVKATRSDNWWVVWFAIADFTSVYCPARLACCAAVIGIDGS